jgi:hypothetical protein
MFFGCLADWADIVGAPRPNLLDIYGEEFFIKDLHVKGVTFYNLTVSNIKYLVWYLGTHFPDLSFMPEPKEALPHAKITNQFLLTTSSPITCSETSRNDLLNFHLFRVIAKQPKQPVPTLL